MKPQKIKKQVLLLAAVMLATVSFAQHRMRHSSENRGLVHAKVLNLPDLTEDQKAKIKELRLEHQKKILDLKNQLLERKTKHRTLTQMSAENVDIKEINTNIDEITKLTNAMMKEHAAHKQTVRKLLTEKQRIYYDTHHMNRQRNCVRDSIRGKRWNKQ